MGRGMHSFRETELRRACKALEERGHRIAGVRVWPDGGFTVLVARPDGTIGEDMRVNSWDEVLEHNGQD